MVLERNNTVILGPDWQLIGLGLVLHLLYIHLLKTDIFGERGGAGEAWVFPIRETVLDSSGHVAISSTVCAK